MKKIHCSYLVAFAGIVVFCLANRIYPSIAQTVYPHKKILKKYPKKWNSHKKMLAITIPKSGTHLLKKCLTLLDIPGINFELTRHYESQSPNIYIANILNNIKKNCMSYPNKQAFNAHLPHSLKAMLFINTRFSVNFFMIRDPRDQLTSMAHMVYKNEVHKKTISLKKVILDLIDGRRKNFVTWGIDIQRAYPLMWKHGVVKFYNLYLPWMKMPNFYTVKFENLIGPQGGGSSEKQIHEIQNIAKHFGKYISKEKAKIVGDNIFGGTWTFRKGQIGSWKQHFTPEIKKAFKETPGACQLLIDLEYEKDDNW